MSNERSESAYGEKARRGQKAVVVRRTSARPASGPSLTLPLWPSVRKRGARGQALPGPYCHISLSLRGLPFSLAQGGIWEVKMARLFVDCRDYPSEKNCTVAISADSREELVDAAAQHAVAVHGHADSPELRQELAKMIKPVTGVAQP